MTAFVPGAPYRPDPQTYAVLGVLGRRADLAALDRASDEANAS